MDVLTGFFNEDGKAHGRPVGVAIDRDGCLLVADDVGNVIWRVTRSAQTSNAFSLISLLRVVARGPDPCCAAPVTSRHKNAHVNRLAQATSPYLLQHKHNPVDWWPWGPEALAEAKRTKKPILLSVGYAACHWCHVMAHE